MITTRQETSQRHIEAAIALFHDGKIDCAITLAAAAEGCLRATTDPHLFQALNPLAEKDELNLVINWLKHPQLPETVEIVPFEGVLTICRAITKFIAVYHMSCAPFEDFLIWQREAGYPFLGTNPMPN